MEYKILKSLVDVKLKKFVSEYGNVCKLFENTDVKNNLIHPGEYGMYKERLMSEMFKYTLPQRYSCGTGFVINTDKEITTQCDIVLYDAENAPFLEVDSGRFFPQEVVYAIGEIKSKLTKRQLFDALIKLAKSKQIRKRFSGLTVQDECVEIDSSNTYEGICTFLICDEIDGWNEDLSLEIQHVYFENEIEKAFHFNLILSLKNGLIAYDSFKAFDLLKQRGLGMLVRNEGHLCCANPYFGKGENRVDLDYFTLHQVDEIGLLKEFLVVLNNYLVHMKSYYPDPVHYLY